jgi:hypothetical protein
MALRPRRFWVVSLGALAVGLTYLGGHLQWSVYAVLALAFYSLFRLIWSKNVPRRRILLAALIIGGAGTALAAVQILPTLEYIRAGHRGYMPFELVQQARDWSSFLMLWVPKFFGEALAPHYWGPSNYNEAMIYVGIAPLLLVFIAMIRRRDGYVIFFAALGIMGALFAAGTDAYRVLHWLPGFDSWLPIRMRYWVMISLSVLAALGLDYLLRSTEQRKFRTSAKIALFPIGLGAVYLIARAGYLPTQPSRLEFIAQQEARLVALLAVAAMLLILYSLSRRWGQWALAGLCVLTLIDLWLLSETYQRPISTQYDYPATPGIQFMMDDPDRFRVLSIKSPDWFKWELRPNLPPLYGLQDVGGYDSVYLQRYANYLQRIDPTGPPSTSSNYLEPGRFDSPLVDLLNVKYALSTDKVQAAGWEVAYKDDLRIYRRTQLMPRAWIAAQAEVVPDDNAILDRLTGPGFDPHQTVVLEQTPIEPLGEAAASPAGNVSIESYANTQLVLKADMQRAGWLVLSEMFYPGWHVTVDGVPANLYRANYILRAVPLPAGAHRIEMRFMPNSFVIGAMMTLVTALGLVLMAVVAWRVEKRRPI